MLTDRQNINFNRLIARCLRGKWASPRVDFSVVVVEFGARKSQVGLGVADGWVCQVQSQFEDDYDKSWRLR